MAKPRSKRREPAAAKTPRRALPPALWLIVIVAAGVSAATLLNGRAAPTETGFDGDRAFAHLQAQCDIGPRYVGSAGHQQCLDYMVRALTPLADSVEKQEFRVPLDGETPTQTNVIARWKGAGGEGRLLAAHWDTRPWADQEFDPAKRRQPILGANDGASGVAVLIELARLLKANPPPRPVMIVLFDGEDYGPGIDRMFLGSRHFAANLPRDVPRQGVLIDMVGDKNLIIPQEQHSARRAPAVMTEVYDLAHARGSARHFPKRAGYAVEDDHIPLLDQGIAMIDLIDFDYDPWHTLADTPDKCSPASLKVVGDVLWDWVTAAAR